MSERANYPAVGCAKPKTNDLKENQRAFAKNLPKNRCPTSGKLLSGSLGSSPDLQSTYLEPLTNFA